MDIFNGSLPPTHQMLGHSFTRWMSVSCAYLDEGPHGEQVGQHGGETLSQAALGDEAELQLRKTNGVIALLPGPARDVQKVGLKGQQKKGILGHKLSNNKIFQT